MIPSVVHLVDDASPGGVTRLLDHIARSSAFGRFGVHRVETVKRGRLTPPQIAADVVVSHLSICWSNLPMLTALRANFPQTPVIHVEHSYSERFHALKVETPERFAALLRTAYSLFDRIVAVSDEQAGWLARRRFVAPGALAVIPPCVDLEPFFAVPQRRPGSVTKLAAIGRFDRQKGFDIVVDALRRVETRGLELHFFGDGPERENLFRRADGDRRIVFHGFTADVASAMARSDAVVMPSRWEPYGLVALEAFAAGRPLLCSTADALAGHVRAGAIGVGDGSHFGWADLFSHLPTLDLDAGVRRARLHAATAEVRFAKNWEALLAGFGARTALAESRAA
jgi:glycosyltransferase involved in cell wall biosynthesis